MVGVRTWLVSLCVAGIAGIAFAQSQCGTVTWGDVSGVPHALLPATLEPAIADWNVEIPVPPSCQIGVQGVIAVICDVDLPPTGRFLQKLLLQVHRNGNVQQRGLVYATVYCQGFQAGFNANVEVSPWDATKWEKSIGLGPIRN